MHGPYLRAWAPTQIPLSPFPTLVLWDRIALLRRLLVVLLLRIVWNSFPDETIDKLGRSQKEIRERNWDCWRRDLGVDAPADGRLRNGGSAAALHTGQEACPGARLSRGPRAPP